MPFGAPYATLQEAWGTPSLKMAPVLHEEPREEAKAIDKEEHKAKQDKEPHHSVKEEQFENTMDRYDYDDRFQEYLKKRNKKSRVRPREDRTDPASFPVIVEDFRTAGDPERQYLNFALYVFSGIVLIFVMEQFIQIGLVIRGSK